jgi:exopolysaccharide production protein ExoQ
MLPADADASTYGFSSAALGPQLCKATKWTIEECIATGLLLLFFTHFYIPVLEPVNDSLFAGSSEDETVMGQLINAGVWLIAGMLTLRYCRKVFMTTRRVAWTAAFALLTLVSVCWSQAPGVTLRKSVFLLLTTAFGIYFAGRFPMDRQLRIICVAASMIAGLSICFAVFLPRYGLDHDAHEGVWVGVFTQKNVCAREMLFILVCLLPYSPASEAMRWVRRFAILCVLVVILGTQSKTAFVMTALSLAFFPLLRISRRLSAGGVLAALTAALVSLAVACVLVLSAIPRILMLLVKDGTITGRTAIWQAVLEAIMKRPLLGYGFAAFWLSLRGESANIILALRWAVPAAHNGFLEIWLQLGVIGLLLYGLGFAQGMISALKNSRQASFERAAWPLSVLLLTIVYNLDESSLMQPNDFLWILYVATLVNVAVVKRAAPATSSPAVSGITSALNSAA